MNIYEMQLIGFTVIAICINKLIRKDTNLKLTFKIQYNCKLKMYTLSQTCKQLFVHTLYAFLLIESMILLNIYYRY